MPVARPICQGQVNLILSCTYTPDYKVCRVKFLRGNRAIIVNSSWLEAQRVRKIEQGRSAYQVGPVACQDAQGLGKEHVIAGCQVDTACRCVEGGKAEITRRRPETVAVGEME